MRTTKTTARPSQLLKVICVPLILSSIAAITMSAGTPRGDKWSAAMLIGTVSDSACGARHGIRAAGDAECVRTCVELGAQYALMVGRKMYVLKGHPEDLYWFAGRKVRVQGRVVNRDTVIVEQVAPWYDEAARGIEVSFGSKSAQTGASQ